MNIAYNNRGMMTQYSLSGVKETNGAARAEGSDYQYHSDGRVKFASDFYGRSFDSMSFHDKSYQHDQVGRLQVALSGVEANDFLNNTNSGPFHGAAPYLQTYTHDAWSNMVERTGWYWSENDEIGPQTYDAHNRNTAWSYDADGRLISMNEPPFNEYTFVPAMHTYDAAGRHVKHTQTTSREALFPSNHPVKTTIATTDAGYDGDGQQVKRVGTTQIDSQPPASGPGYYLRSSVLGGQVITEIDAQGGRFKSHVYGGGALIASTNAAGLVWRFNNPVTGDGRETDAQGKLVAASYVDPDGMDVGELDPANAPSDPEPPTLPMAGAYGSLFPGGGGAGGTSCIVDGIEMGCGLAGVMMDMGAAGQCPNNNCNPRMKDGVLRPLILTRRGFGFAPNAKKKNPPTLKPPLTPQEKAAIRQMIKERGQNPYGGGGEEHTPFNRVVLTELVNTALADPACVDFYTTILAKVSTKRNPVLENGNLARIFDRFLENGTFTREVPLGATGPANAYASGLIGSKAGGSIYVNDQGGDINFMDAYFTVGEMFHLAGSRELYDDQQLAYAVHTSQYAEYESDLDPKGNIYSPLYDNAKTETKESAYSYYFHTIQQQVCAVRRPSSHHYLRY